MERRIFLYSDPHSVPLLYRIKDEASVADFVIGLGDYTPHEKSSLPPIVLEFTDIPLMGNHDTGAVRCGRVEVFGLEIGLLGGVYSSRKDRRPREAFGHDDRILEYRPRFRGRIQTERFLLVSRESAEIIENGPVGYEGYYTTGELERVAAESFEVFLSHDGPARRSGGYRGDLRIASLIERKRPRIAVYGHHHVLAAREKNGTKYVVLDYKHYALLIVSSEPRIAIFPLRYPGSRRSNIGQRAEDLSGFGRLLCLVERTMRSTRRTVPRSIPSSSAISRGVYRSSSPRSIASSAS